jgi:hypothetical protein
MPISLKPKPNTIAKNIMTSISVAPSQLSIKESAQTTRPEIELLLCCARTQPSSEISQQIQNLVQQSINWDFLLQTAARHKVLPLLYQNLKTLCPEAVPKPVLSELRNFFHTNAANNLFHTQELLKILKLFQDNDIPVIPFKGPVLAASVYGNLALRQFGDLDILVHERDHQQAKALLLGQGHQWMYDIEHEMACLQTQLWHEGNQISVDLHYGIPPKPLQLNTEELLNCIQSISLNGTKVQAFSPEAHLLVLCVNGYKDSWSQLNKICDVAAMIGNQPMNWESLIELAKRLKIDRILDLGLLLAGELLDAPLSEKIWSRVKSNSVLRWLAARLQVNLIFSNKNPQIDIANPLTLFLHKLCYRALMPFPASPLYYLLRSIRLLVSICQDSFNSFLSTKESVSD